MVTGDTVENIRVQHRGNIVDNVIDAAYTIVDQFALANESMGAMKEIQLSRSEEEIFARASLELKYGNVEKQPITTRQILLPKQGEFTNPVSTTKPRVGFKKPAIPVISIVERSIHIRNVYFSLI